MKNVAKTDATAFDKKYVGTSPLRWCPKCGRPLVSSQISITGGKQAITGDMCKACGYIHDMSVK